LLGVLLGYRALFIRLSISFRLLEVKVVKLA
jgi:hypothetical protein